MRLAAISQIDQNRISNKVKSYLPRNILRIEVATDSIRYLILEFPEISALRRNPALTGWGVPGCYQDAGLLTGLNLKYDFVHVLTL
jgi:hypothetical protein